MSGYKKDSTSSAVQIDLQSGDFVYPRIVEDGIKYNKDDVSSLFDINEEIESLRLNQQVEEEEETEEEDEGVLVQAIEDNLKRVADAIQNELSDDPSANFSEDGDFVSDVIGIRNEQDSQDAESLYNDNNSVMEYKVTLPNFPLPKKTYTSDYFSNYLNSGESYVVTPLLSYTTTPVFASYGNEYGTLAYYINSDPSRIDSTNQQNYRTVVNSTCDGIYIDTVSFCKGDTAIYDNRRYSYQDRNLENGLVTNISSSGIIKKDNFLTPDSWLYSINYFYAKNYVASFNVLPSFSEQEYANMFNSAFEKVKTIIGGPSSDSQDVNSFFKKGGRAARIFVEREIYTEKFNTNQIQEFNRSFNSGTLTTADADLSTEEEEKLYCVQNYDVTDFVKTNGKFFYPVQNYDESLEFFDFIPWSGSVSSGYAENKSTVNSYFLNATTEIGNVLFTDRNPNYKKLFRAEYITGSASSFTYTNFSNSVVWDGQDEDPVSITNFNTKQYGYHLYGYNTNSDVLRLIKTNVQNGYIAKISPFSYGAVLRFNKLEYTNQTFKYIIADSLNGTEASYTALGAGIFNSSFDLVSPDLVKVNVQSYLYNVVSPQEINHWHIFNENPINNNTYGERSTVGLPQPRFFQDEAEENKSVLEDLFYFPNGPYTSKNYEGSPIDINHINSFADGLFENNIYVKEESQKAGSVFESNCSIDFVDNGQITKLKSLPQIRNKNNNVSFNQTRRLKITRVKYNFYVKDLVLIGDAGSPYSINFNAGWEYKLQYRIKNSSDSWLELDNENSFSKDKILSQGGAISPFYYLASNLSIPSYLSMVAFRTNLPLFLDDNNYEFRIAKYEKLVLSNDNVDVTKKTNFFPIKVNWTDDPTCLYYNVYQKDINNNLTLIKTENNTAASFTYAIPDVKQVYVDQGLFNSPNGSGFFDVVVSGVMPAVSTDSNSISGEYGFPVGDSNEQFDVKKLSDNTNYSTKSIASPTYSTLLDFNNPETKTTNFTINQNYNNYYFISDGASTVSLENLPAGFEGYVANINASSCSVGSTSIAQNNIAIIKGATAPTTTSKTAIPSSSFDLSDLKTNEVLYLKAGVTITDVSSLTASENYYIKAINDSSSSITVSYKLSSVSISANKTSFLSFNNTTVSSQKELSNRTTQDSSIYYPNTGLVNLDHVDLYLDPTKSFSKLPIYNLSKNSLVVNDSLSLESDSFNLIDWNGSTATKTVKTYFDDIKIHLFGTETPGSVYYLKDDTEIIISQFDASEAFSVEYYFIKDELVKRNLNIKITDGASSFIIPRQNQDFKLKLSRLANGERKYDILYPSSNPFFDITNDLEQLILLNSDAVQNIDLYYLEAKIPKDAFIYFVNKSGKSIGFSKGSTSKPQYVLAQNQIARASIVTVGSAKSIKIDIINNAYSHFEFEIKPSVHLTGAVNILDLDFCGSEIKVPSISSFTGQDLFLICRNRTVPNKINPNTVICDSQLIEEVDNKETLDVNEIGDLSSNSISLRLYKKNSTDKFPTLERTSFLSFNQVDILPLISNDTIVDEDKTEYFYINDTGNALSSYTIRDSYNRKYKYDGKVFLQSNKLFTVKSFDGNHSISTSTVENSSRKLSNSISFDYYPDNYTNGRLAASQQNDALIKSKVSETGGTQVTFGLTTYTNQIFVNFAFDSVNINNLSKRLNKNRILKRTGSNLVYPIYNKKEFFLSRSRPVSASYTLDSETYYYEINASATDIDSIIIPDSIDTVSSNRQFIIRNLSGRPFLVKALSYDNTVSTYSTIINADDQVILSYTTSWSIAADTSEFPENYLIINSSNQNPEIDSLHPLSDLWNNSVESFSFDLLQNAFIGGTGKELTLLLGETQYNYVDVYNVLNITAQNALNIYCFGRKIEVSTNYNYFVNAFYLFAVTQNQIVRYGQVLNKITGEISNLTLIEDAHIDLSKYLNKAQSVSDLPDVILIPIVSPLATYYLPNLGASVIDWSTGNSVTVGSLLNGKKIIFVNLVSYNLPAKIYNYSDSSYSSLQGSFSILSFEASSSVWTASVSNPKAQTVCPTLKNVYGRSATATSEMGVGNEFVYLNNFSKFDIDTSSFLTSDFKDFYIFNSASNNVITTSNGSLVSNRPFLKLSRNKTSNSFNSSSLLLNGNAPFSVVELDVPNSVNENEIYVTNYVKNAYGFLKPGSVIKVIALIGALRYTYLFKFNSLNDPILTALDEDFASLDLYNIKTYLPEHELFVYGSSNINEDQQYFDSYLLKILKSDLLDNEKFYIYNNTPNELKLFFKQNNLPNDPYVAVPSKRMIEISKNSARFMEYHQKGKFYISKRAAEISYLHKISSSIFLDNLFDYENPIQLNDNGQIQTSLQNLSSDSLVSVLLDDFNYFYYSSYRQIDTAPPSSYFSFFNSNRKSFLLSSSEDMLLETNPLAISKPRVKISSGGHYIIDNNNSDLSITADTNEIFLVNNCAKDIIVAKTDGASIFNLILYRNTVLVIKSGASDRYLKKSKRRDEFYCVFNPKTAISTQREVTLSYGIPRSYDVLPLLDLNNYEQQSYVKLLAKDGSSTIVYLNLIDYYNGKGIPTDSPQNILAYEVGIGHETFYKFLFFNPSNSSYTLPGIVEGETYEVEVDEGLIRDLQNLPDIYGEFNQVLLDAGVIYNGKEYKNGDRFTGTTVSNYDIRYPNYVKVSKVISEIGKQFGDAEIVDEEVEDGLILQEEPIDDVSLFYQNIIDSIRPTFNSALVWIPQAEDAFWFTGSFSKDLWEIIEVYPNDKISFKYPDPNSPDRYINFVKCKFKKEDFKTPLLDYSWSKFSALQSRDKAVDAADLTLELSNGLSSSQLGKIKTALRALQNRDDYLLNSNEMFIDYIYKDTLLSSFNNLKDKLTNPQIEITFKIYALDSLPFLEFEDFSKSSIIEIINQPNNSILAENPNS
jgi:hypothetical protein